MDKVKKIQLLWFVIISFLIVSISILHYTTPTMKWQYHLIFMQAYFIPILIGAFQFGIRGGLGAAIAVTVLYLPHIMLHWGGLVEENLMRFLQILLFNVIGYLTGLKAQKENDEKIRYQFMATELEKNYKELKIQSEQLVELEEQLRHSDRLAVVGELSTSLAHEVRNPLGAIRGAVEIIRDTVPEKMKNFEFLNIIIEETKRLNEVVENYLRFTQTKEKQVIQYNVIDIIKNSIILLSNQANKKNIELNLNLPEEPVSLIGNPNDIRQILINLIINSIQSIENNGQINVYFKLSDEELEKNLKISVKDTGKGMNEKEFEKIFKPFYTSKKGGTGLGLSIVKRIIDANDWTIKVTSNQNLGTEFTITIPVNS